MRRFFQFLFHRNVIWTSLFLVIVLIVYFKSIRSQGEVVSISINKFGEQIIAVVPAYQDGAVAWMEAKFVTDVPTQTPISTNTQIPNLSRTPTGTINPTKISEGTPTFTPTITKTPLPSITPTTHASFIGYDKAIHTYNTYGSSESAASFNTNGRLYLVIADGTQGLKIVDITNPDQLLEIRYPLREAYSVKVIGSTAYVAAGKDGVVILDLANPIDPIAIDKRATVGPAIDLDVSFRFFYTKDKATGLTRGYYKTRIYVAMGNAGLQVITTSPFPEEPSVVNIDKKDLRNKSIGKLVYYDTDEQVLAVTEAHSSKLVEFVFIADGKDGVKVLDLSTAYDRPIRESDVVHSLDIAYAWDVGFAELLEHRVKQDRQFFWLIVAAGKDGVFAYKVRFDADPREATYGDSLAIRTPGEARSITIYHNNFFIGDGEGGAQVIDFNNPDHPVLMPNGRYEFEWRSIPILYALKQSVWNNIASPGSQATIGNVVTDGFLCIFSLLIVAFLLSGVLMPVKSIRERLGVLRLTLANWVNVHGAVWVIEDGRKRYHNSKDQRHGRGVLLQDTNSASIFDQHVGRLRISDNQLTFIGKEEHLVWQTELSRRQLMFGPRRDDPNPFKMRGINEERADYRARQYRRELTSGKTIDDVEIVATIRVVYSLEDRAADNQDEFGFGAGMITSGYRGGKPPVFKRISGPVRYWKQRLPLENLIEKLVSGIWKLSVSEYSLKDLFLRENQLNGQSTGLQTIQQDMIRLLVNRDVDVLNNYEYAENIKTIRENFRELMGGNREGVIDGRNPEPGRGIRIHEVQMVSIRIPDEGSQYLFEQWIEEWHKGNKLKVFDPHQWEYQEALVKFAEYAIQYFGNQPEEQKAHRLMESLARLLRGTLEALPPGDSRDRLVAVIRRLGGSDR